MMIDSEVEFVGMTLERNGIFGDLNDAVIDFGIIFIQERISSDVAVMNAVCGSNPCRLILPSIPVDVPFEKLRE